MRYVIKLGKFGAYFYDTWLDQDVDLNEAKNIMNLYALENKVGNSLKTIKER